MFGRERVRKEVSPKAYKATTIAVIAFTGVCALLILTSMVAAIRG